MVGMRNRREYQRSLSKQKMNDIKYNVRGSTHKKGTLATSMQTWLVVATSSVEGTIARKNQSKLVCQVGEGTSRRAVLGRLPVPATPRVAMPHAEIAHSTAKIPKLQDQILASSDVAKSHSKTAGKLINARSDATFESA